MSFVGDGKLEIKVLVPFASGGTNNGGGGDPPNPPDPTLVGSDYYYQHNQGEALAAWNILFDAPWEDPNTPLEDRDGEHSKWEQEHGETKIPVVRVWVDTGGSNGYVQEVYPDIQINMAQRHCLISFTSPQTGYATFT